MIVQKSENEFLGQNQKYVLDLLLNSENRDFALYLSKENQKVRHITFDFTISKTDNKNDVKKLDQPYLYHSKLIEVLATTAIGKSGMQYSENKLR